MRCRHYSFRLATIIAGIIASTCAQASTVRVGSAVTVVRDVSGSVSGMSWEKKIEGDDVYENEFVRTAARSSAVISFVDETKISIGQAATMKIDHVVLKSNRSVEELIVSFEAGAMRWNSGTSPSSAYQVKTPDAIIRPLGTFFDLLVESQRTMVMSRSGTIEVCSVGAPQRCRTLSRPGEIIVATPSNLEEPQRGGLRPSEFADRCLSADAVPCLITASISPPQPASPEPRVVPPPLPPISTCGPDQGVWPNCCPPGLYWDGQRCFGHCPSDSIGTWPNCRCRPPLVGRPGSCTQRCPSDSIGTWPNCRCRPPLVGAPGSCRKQPASNGQCLRTFGKPGSCPPPQPPPGCRPGYHHVRGSCVPIMPPRPPRPHIMRPRPPRPDMRPRPRPL